MAVVFLLTLLLTPQKTILDFRQEAPLNIPSKLEAGDFLLFDFDNAPFLFMDQKLVSRFPNGQVFAAPAEESYGYYGNLYYREQKNEILVWWSKSIKIEEKKYERIFRLPASVATVDVDYAFRNLLSSVSKKSKGNLRSSCFSKPLASKVVSNFGEPRYLPNGKFYRHTGIDQRAWTGVAIKSVSDARVLYMGENAVTGQMIILDHGAGMTSRYLHLSAYKTQLGSQIKKGQVIGLSGNSGRSLAPHLHWELSWKGYPLDPLRFLRRMERICDQG